MWIENYSASWSVNQSRLNRRQPLSKGLKSEVIFCYVTITLHVSCQRSFAEASIQNRHDKNQGKIRKKKHTHTILHNIFYNHSTRGSFVARAKVTKSENPRLLSQLFRRTSRTGKLWIILKEHLQKWWVHKGSPISKTIPFYTMQKKP